MGIKFTPVVLLLLLMVTASATVTTLGSFTIDEQIDLPQVANATACNITAIKYPNSTAFIKNVAMTKDGTDFNFTLGEEFVSERGVYLVNGECDLTVFVYDFEVTPTGTVLTTSQGLLYIVFLFSAVLLFSFCLFWVFNLPGRNATTPLGDIISINDLKYLKIFLVPICYVLFMWIFALLHNITASFLILTGPEKFFFWGYRILLGFAYPLTIFGLWIFFILIINDRKILQSLKTGRAFNINDSRR